MTVLFFQVTFILVFAFYAVFTVVRLTTAFGTAISISTDTQIGRVILAGFKFVNIITKHTVALIASFELTREASEIIFARCIWATVVKISETFIDINVNSSPWYIKINDFRN